MSKRTELQAASRAAAEAERDDWRAIGYLVLFRLACAAVAVLSLGFVWAWCAPVTISLDDGPRHTLLVHVKQARWLYPTVDTYDARTVKRLDVFRGSSYDRYRLITVLGKEPVAIRQAASIFGIMLDLDRLSDFNQALHAGHVAGARVELQTDYLLACEGLFFCLLSLVLLGLTFNT